MIIIKTERLSKGGVAHGRKQHFWDHLFSIQHQNWLKVCHQKHEIIGNENIGSSSSIKPDAVLCFNTVGDQIALLLSTKAALGRQWPAFINASSVGVVAWIHKGS